MGRLSGSVATLESPPPQSFAGDVGADPDRRGVRSDLVVRTGPQMRVRTGAQIPLLVDLAQLYVFDHAGRRICPAPDGLPGLEE